MVKKSSNINQFGENVDEYVLDIEANTIQRNCIPEILNTIRQSGIQITKYGLHYADDNSTHQIYSEKPAAVAGILWDSDWCIEQLNVLCNADTYRFWLHIVIASNCMSVSYPHDNPNPIVIETLLSKIEASLCAKQ